MHIVAIGGYPFTLTSGNCSLSWYQISGPNCEQLSYVQFKYVEDDLCEKQKKSSLNYVK